jgi:hypothetical protein
MVPFNADKLMVKWWGKSFVRGLTAAKFLFGVEFNDDIKNLTIASRANIFVQLHLAKELRTIQRF